MSSQRLARITGLLYALNIAIGISAIMLTRQDKALADTVNLAGAAEYAVVVVLLGRLFGPAARGLSWLVAAIGLAACAISAAMILKMPLLPADVNPVVVFGPYCIGLGAVIVRTGLMPRVLGLLLVVAGFSWLTFAMPGFARQIAPWNTAAGAVPELLLTLYLLTFGIRAAPKD